MSVRKTVVSHFEPPHVSLRGYVMAFVTCIVLTLGMYAAAVSDSLTRTQVLALVAILAVIQCVVQLRKFLHLGEEFKPRWKLLLFGLMLSIVLIVVIGSLWIMDNLNYRMMHSPSEAQEYVERGDSL